MQKWNTSIPWVKKSDYILRCIEEIFAPSSGGNPMVTLKFEVAAPDTVIDNNGEELQSHLRYVLQLIHTQAIDRNSYMMLIGYVETHKENCDEDDCPLKMKKSSKKKKKKTNVSSKLQPNSKNYNGFSK